MSIKKVSATYMSLEEVLATYVSLREKGESEEDIFENLKNTDGSILARVFTLEFCLTKQYAIDWSTILECYPTRGLFILNSVSPETRGIIYALSGKFRILWLSWCKNTKWCYVGLSTTFVRLNLSIHYIDHNISKGWCFEMLSGHPSLTLGFVKRHKDREWCYCTLFDRFPGEYDTNLLITTESADYTINIPSFFQLTSLYYHPLVPRGRKNYYTMDGVKLPRETLISDVLDGVHIKHY